MADGQGDGEDSSQAGEYLSKTSYASRANAVLTTLAIVPLPQARRVRGFLAPASFIALAMPGVFTVIHHPVVTVVRWPRVRPLYMPTASLLVALAIRWTVVLPSPLAALTFSQINELKN